MLRSISQMPVVLIPLHFDRDPVVREPSAQRSIVLRPFVTNDFMTGMPVIPGSDKLPIPVRKTIFPTFTTFVTLNNFQVIERMVTEILNNVPGISRVLYDLTSKPPGTTEWE